MFQSVETAEEELVDILVCNILDCLTFDRDRSSATVRLCLN